MDGALLLIAANESCPQPQTSEHLAAVEIMRLKHIIILQNKIDLIPESAAANQHEAITGFIQVCFSFFLCLCTFSLVLFSAEGKSQGFLTGLWWLQSNRVELW